ncbi:MAG: DUF2914 domain-containing protein [Patescibacteria group bacterium]
MAFFAGFVVDNITLNRVDQLFDNVILATYVVLAMASLLLLYATTAGQLPERYNEKVRFYAPLLVQFSFGGLLSGMLIFYGRSGDWLVSWPFLLMILAVIYFNETLRDRASRLIYNLAILFIGLISYIVLVIPVFTGYMGPWVFVGSGVLALVVMYLFVQLLYRIVPKFMELQMKSIVFTLGAIFFGMNFLYFANIIPPIPLSLKEVGIYHSVVRFENGDYQLKYEKGAWWEFFKDSDDTFHPTPGGAVFCFAKVFAPTRLETDIFHTWEYQDDNGDWQEHFRASYPISGGSDGGYRGYTLVQNFRDGDWRCSVETERGQVLGREHFEVDSTESVGELITRIE